MGRGRAHAGRRRRSRRAAAASRPAPSSSSPSASNWRCGRPSRSKLRFTTCRCAPARVIDRHRRAQRDSIRNGRPLARARRIARLPAIDFQSPSSGPLLAKLRPALSASAALAGSSLAAGVEEHAVHADRPAQRRIVRHRVGAGAGRQAEAEVQQAVPDRRPSPCGRRSRRLRCSRPCRARRRRAARSSATSPSPDRSRCRRDARSRPARPARARGRRSRRCADTGSPARCADRRRSPACRR